MRLSFFPFGRVVNFFVGANLTPTSCFSSSGKPALFPLSSPYLASRKSCHVGWVNIRHIWYCSKQIAMCSPLLYLLGCDEDRR